MTRHWGKRGKRGTRPSWAKKSTVLAGMAAMVLSVGCHPLAGYFPEGLPTDAPKERQTDGITASVDIQFDKMGIPFIKANTETDLAFGWGYAHGRDRLFQIDLLRHAATGTLTELFGADFLDTDRRLRLLAYNLEAQYEALSQRDKDYLLAYAAGVNAAAKDGGQTAEMALLGKEFAPFKPIHTLAIARLQAWDLSHGMDEELVRARIDKLLSKDDPRRALFFVKAATRGVPIVTDSAHSGDRLEASVTPRPAPHLESGPSMNTKRLALNGPASSSMRQKLARALIGGEQLKTDIEDLAKSGLGGASNSWAVSGAHTTTGNPVIVNDPHLGHQVPSIFYMVRLEGPDLKARGVSIPGTPAILIGATEHAAWGLTTSNADTQDVVRLKPTPDGRRYYVDGGTRPFTRTVEEFDLGDGRVHRETWLGTEYGVVLPSSYDEDAGGEMYALQWSGHDVGGTNSRMISGFVDLLQAKNLAEFEVGVDRIRFSGQNMSIGFTDGTIAYRLSATVPRRHQPASYLPMDGTDSRVRWAGYYDVNYRPQLTNPEVGYFVTANQRITDDTGPLADQLGAFGANPHRAKRINERVQEAITGGKAEPQALLDIQQDSQSTQARALLPVLKAHCPSSGIEGHKDETAAAFCEAIKGFDGNYTVDAMGALPFELLMGATHDAAVRLHLGDDVGGQLGRTEWFYPVLEDAMVAEHEGTETLVFNDPNTDGHDGLKWVLKPAMAAALTAIVEMAGENPNDWRWGKNHRAEWQNPLSRAPAIGAYFAVNGPEEPGCRYCVRSERSMPRTRVGAATRMLAEVTPEGPKLRMVIDTGQSGHAGHAHYGDQQALWAAGEPFEFDLGAPSDDEREGWIKLVP